MKTNELQQLTSILGSDSLLADTAAAGTGRLTLAQAAQFFDQELIKPNTQIGASLSQKAAKSVQETVEQITVSRKAVNLSGAEVQGYLDNLPRLITDNYNIAVSGAIPGELRICNFYGCGSINIYGTAGAPATANTVQVQYNSVWIAISYLSLAATQNDQVLMDVYCSRLSLTSSSFSGAGYTNIGGLFNGSGQTFCNTCNFENLRTAIRSRQAEIIAVRACTGSDNSIGLEAYQGGIILLQDTPDLLGGASNTKYGGLIAKSDGTLL